MTSPTSQAELVQLEGPRRSPLINRSLDNTALNAFMTCARLYKYSMVDSRRLAGPPSPAIAYGTTWHAIMEAHYRTGGDEGAVQKAAVMSWEQHDRAEDHRTVQRAIAEYYNYLVRWGSHSEDTTTYGETVGWPDQPSLEIPVELWWPGALHPYAGKIDRIIKYQGLYYVEDHKTTASCSVDGPSSGYYFKQFDPNNQMMGYAWLAMQLTGLPIAGVRIKSSASPRIGSRTGQRTTTTGSAASNMPTNTTTGHITTTRAQASTANASTQTSAHCPSASNSEPSNRTLS
jgi:hypothetical protein